MPVSGGARFYYRDPDAPAPNQPIGVGALALIERDGRLLMERRRDCGRWGLPGGATDVDESLEDTLEREVLEETGLAVVRHSLFRVFDDPSRIVHYPDGNVIRLLSFVYHVEIESGEPRRGSESEEVAFLLLEEIQRLDIVETARPVIEVYLAALAKE